MNHLIKMDARLLQIAIDCKTALEQWNITKDKALCYFWLEKYNAELDELKQQLNEMNEYIKVFQKLKKSDFPLNTIKYTK